MKIEPNFIKLLEKIVKPEDVQFKLIQDSMGKWCIRWGGYSDVFLEGSTTRLDLGLTEFISIDENNIVKFIDNDENNTVQHRGEYPLSLIKEIQLGI